MSSYEFSYALEEALGTGVLSVLFRGSLSGVLGIAAYVLTALALYTIAKRRGLHKPWLAWIPVVNVWLVGSLSDQYRYVVRGESKSKRKALLILKVIAAVLSVVISVYAIVMVGQIVVGVMGGRSEEYLMEAVFGRLIGIVGMSLPLVGVSIAYAIVYYMALSDIYKSLDPGNSVLFLVLSIVGTVALPLLGLSGSLAEALFLFCNRNKELGMPPRRQEPEYIPQEPQWQEPQESWESEDKDYL